MALFLAVPVAHYVSESFIHLGTDWHTPTDDQKVAWEIKTARQPVSLASVDFTGSSRASASRFLVVQDVSISTSLMQILQSIQNRFLPDRRSDKNAACRNIRVIRRSEYFDSVGLQIKDKEITKNRIISVIFHLIIFCITYKRAIATAIPW